MGRLDCRLSYGEVWTWSVHWDAVGSRGLNSQNETGWNDSLSSRIREGTSGHVGFSLWLMVNGLIFN